MGKLVILGAGAFGTAMAVCYADAGHEVTLWGRGAALWADTRENPRLPGVRIPDRVALTDRLPATRDDAVVLLAIPTQALAAFMDEARLAPGDLVSLAKGIEVRTGRRPSQILAAACPGARVAAISGPGFAGDVARGLPTAMTLAAEGAHGARLQRLLSTPVLRLYLSADLVGVELAGALKNVMAIACGVVIGAGLGESARAALLARGYAEMRRLATTLGAQADTLAGLAGLGDLVLTCTSARSRNFAFGHAIGAGRPPPQDQTTEGVATALALADIAAGRGLDLPIGATVAGLLRHELSVAEAVQRLLMRPLASE